MNEYDSEKVVRLLSETHLPVQTAEDADLVVINTCSVREKGEHKLFSLLGALRDLKKERPELVVGVMGCVAQQEGEIIAKRNSAVDFVVGTHNLSLVPSLVEAVRNGQGVQVAVDYRDEWEELPLGFAEADFRDPAADIDSPSWIPNRIRALVSIQRGCNKNCSYCVVPTTRGKEISRSPDEILREVALKARLGAKEVVLLGQTVNSFGRDLLPRYPFESLIREIAKIPGVQRIRFSSPHPAEVKAPFIELYGEVPQLVPHIHMPLQSGSDRILRLMNRNYKKRRYLEIIEELRARLPDIAVTTDIIVGFPTETEEDFAESLAIVEQVRFQASFSFKYSRRPNTTAIADFAPGDEISPEIAQARLEMLQKLQDRLTAENNVRMIGKTVEVLVEKVRGVDHPYGRSVAWGRIPQNIALEIMESPELSSPANSRTNPLALPSLQSGALVQVRVTHGSAHSLRGEILSNAPGSAENRAGNGAI